MSEKKAVAKKTEDFKKLDELDWIRIRNDFDLGDPIESSWDKGVRKMKANPFVPIGCLATLASLSYGLYNFYKGRTLMSQYMMRARVAAQAFTIAAMVVGFIVTAKRQERNQERSV